MPAEIRFATEEVEDKLIDEILKLNPEQEANVKKAFAEIKNNPNIGEKLSLPIPVETDYYHSRHIGKMKHLTIYYDNKEEDHILIIINAISVN